MDLAAILAEGVLLFQKHHDPRGSEVDDAGMIDRAGAALFNIYEDWLIALQTNYDAMSAASAQVFDTRSTGATTTASIASAATGNFEIVVPATRLTVSFLRCQRDAGAGSAGGVLSLYVDAARTKLCYRSEMKEGDPAVDVADFTDTLAWGSFSDDGTGLTDLKLYGSFQNLSASASTYTIRLVAVAF